MKKLMVTMMVIGVLVISAFSVSAAEIEGDVTSNMDSDTFVEQKTEQIEAALAEGIITEEQADLLLEHILERAEEAVFGRGPNYGLSEDKETCVLGEDGGLGIFRNQNSGQRMGQGNGVKQHSGDGTGAGTGRGNRGSGQGNNGVCVVTD